MGLHFDNLLKFFRLIFKNGKKGVLISTFLSVINGAIPLAIIYVLKLSIDSLQTISGGFSEENLIAEVTLFLIVIAAMILVNILVSSLANLTKEQFAHRMTDYFFDIIHKKTAELDLQFFENPLYYDIIHRATQEVGYRPTRIIDAMLSLVNTGVTLFLVLIVLSTFHWVLVPFILISGIPVVFLRLKQINKLYLWRREKTSEERKGQYYHRVLTEATFAKELHIFNLQAFFEKRFQDVRENLRDNLFKMRKKQTLYEGITLLFSVSVIFFLIGFILLDTLKGNSSTGNMILGLLVLYKGVTVLNNFTRGLSNLYENNLFLTNFFELIQLKPVIIEPEKPKPFPVPILENIEFRNVSFKYPGTNRKVLNNIQMIIPAGKTVALVGKNGAGKSSLVKLLCKFYEPTSGSLFIDGINISEFNSSEYQSGISAIFQDYNLYNLTAGENIRLGNIALCDGEDKCNEAAKTAGIHDVIDSLPKGYETVLGRVFEHSEELSIGEWQKVALARAFFRNSQFLIFDEPTSALDAEAEHDVIQKFMELAKGRTCLIISHKFSTVKLVDLIFVLDNNRIVESGNHVQLMEMNGVYANLFRKQAQHY